jgi:hypothetical protein
MEEESARDSGEKNIRFAGGIVFGRGKLLCSSGPGTDELKAALHYFAYDFIEIHRTLRVTSAKAAGATDRLWDVSDLVSLWENGERTRRAAQYN